MENNELFKTIEQLKDTLSGVDSAQQQVVQVTSAYDGLRNKVDNFVATLSKLISQFDSLRNSLLSERTDNLSKYKSALDSMKQSCDDLISDFSGNCENIAFNFKQKASQFINDAQVETANLRTEITRLENLEAKFTAATESVKGVRTQLESISKELSDSQKAQDEGIATIKGKLNEFFEKSKTDVSAINNSLTSISSKLGEISQSISDHNSSIQDNLRTLADKIASIEDILNTNHQALLKESKTNRTLFLVGIAIVAILAIIQLMNP